MAIVEIVDVVKSDPDRERIRGYGISIPKPGDQGEVFTVTVKGWVLGRRISAQSVEFVCDDVPLRTVPVRDQRMRMALRYPAVPGARNCGFVARVGVLGVPPEFDLDVRAVMEDETRVPLGKVRIRHQPLRSLFEPSLHPVLVTSQARTGTTYVMKLLAGHPDVVVPRSYPYEVRTAGYWMHVLKVLSEPSNLFQSTSPDNFWANRWWVGHNPYYGTPLTGDPQTRLWLGRTYVERLAAFFQKSIEETYRNVAHSQSHQRAPVCFAEKCSPTHIPWLFWELYPRTREIILVRDYRDVVASILAFNIRRELNGFGRAHVDSDEQFVHRLRYGLVALTRSWRQRSEQAYLMRYEDLILRPEDTLKSVLDYLQLDSSTSMVEDMLSYAQKDTPELRGHRTSSSPQDSIGRWRRDLDESLQAACMEAFGDILEEFGYDTNG